MRDMKVKMCVYCFCCFWNGNKELEKNKEKKITKRTALMKYRRAEVLKKLAVS